MVLFDMCVTPPVRTDLYSSAAQSAQTAMVSRQWLRASGTIRRGRACTREYLSGAAHVDRTLVLVCVGTFLTVAPGFHPGPPPGVVHPWTRTSEALDPGSMNCAMRSSSNSQGKTSDDPANQGRSADGSTGNAPATSSRRTPTVLPRSRGKNCAPRSSSTLGPGRAWSGVQGADSPRWGLGQRPNLRPRQPARDDPGWAGRRRCRLGSRSAGAAPRSRGIARAC